MMRQYGLDVTIVEMMPRLVPEMDADLAAELQKVFEKRGMTIHCDAKVDAVTLGGAGVQAKLASGETLEAERDAAVRRPGSGDGRLRPRHAEH